MVRVLRSYLGLTVFLLVLADSAAAVAESSARIVIVGSPATDPKVLSRLHAELVNLGFAVVEAPSGDEGAREPGATGEASPEALASAARREGALAAIRVVPAGRGVAVWIADLVTGKTVVRTLEASQPDVHGEVVALQAVELLRASLMELTLRQAQHGVPSAGPVTVLLPESRSVDSRDSASPPHRLFVQAAPAALLDRGIGLSGHVALGARMRLVPPIALRAFAFLPVLAASLVEPEGKADASVTLAGMGIDADLLPARFDWKLRAGGGVALTYLRVRATPGAGYAASTESSYAACVLLSGSAAYRVGPRIEIQLELLGGVSEPRPVIFFAERRVAAWGRPMGGAALGIALGVY